MNNIRISFEQSVPDILVGMLYLILAIALGIIVKNLVIRALKALKLDEKLGENAKDASSITELLGKLAFVLTILFFLPGIFDRFGLTNISAPLMVMMGTFLGYIPRLMGAGMLLFLGIVIAKVVQQLMKAFLTRMRVDRLKSKMGMEDAPTAPEEVNSTSVSLADVGGKALYVLVLIPFLIAALEVLQIRAITDPLVMMLSTITAMIPNILAASLVILLGLFIAKLLGDLLEELLTSFGFSRKLAKAMDEPLEGGFNLSHVVAMMVKALILLFFTVQAFDILGLTLFTAMGGAIIAYLPMVLSATLLLLGGYILGSMAKKFLIRALPQARFQGILLKGVVMILASLMALSHLGIGAFFVEILFIAVVASSAVAFALSFGIGGRDFAKNTMAKVEKAMEENQDTMNTLKKTVEEEDRQKELQKTDLL